MNLSEDCESFQGARKSLLRLDLRFIEFAVII